MEYTHIGYYNGIDAVRLMNCTPDEVVNNVKGNNGHFISADDNFAGDEDYINLEMGGEYTKDEEYLVVYDVAIHWNDIDVNTLTDDEVCDEFIDIYKKNH